jgi:hypothetical protein
MTKLLCITSGALCADLSKDSTSLSLTLSALGTQMFILVHHERLKRNDGPNRLDWYPDSPC